MALAQIVGAYATWIMANRSGGIPAGVPYDATVNDLAVGDFLVGSRAHVTALGVTGTTRSVTVSRLGVPMGTVTMVGASAIRIVRSS
jgi:hypothetical protein